jgi:hypothetical protein
MRYDSVLPKTLLQAIIDRDNATANPELPVGAREEAVSWLRRVLADFDAFEAHVGFLREQLNIGPRLRSGEQAPSSSSALRRAIEGLYMGFRHNRPLPEAQALAVARQGLGILGEETLALLLVNPAALKDLWSLIETRPSDYWRSALEEAGKERMAGHGRTIPSPPPDPSPGKKIPTVTEESRVRGKLSLKKLEELRQALPQIFPDLTDPGKREAFLEVVKEQFSKLPADQPFHEAVADWYARFSRQ